jgi:hypothetical protein
MAKGDVKCCGSSLFLKGRYGVGYTLTLTKGEKFDEPAVIRLIESSIPDASVLSNIAAEISFRLPFQSSPHFADVFDHFDSNQQKLGMVNYAISVTTLEEVFLRVGHEDDASPQAQMKKKRALNERQRSLSISQNERGLPMDLAEAPVGSPELLVEGSSSSARSQYGSVAGGNRARNSPPGTGGNLQVNVRPSASPSSVDLEEEEEEKSSNHPLSAKVAQEKEKRLVRSGSSAKFSNITIPGEEVPMYWRHFKALFLKRFINAKRDRKVWTWTLVYPFLILLIGVGLISLTNKTNHPNAIIDTALLSQGTVNYVPVSYTNATGDIPFFDSTRLYDDTEFQSNVLPTNLNPTQIAQWLLDQILPSPQQPYSRYNAFSSGFTPLPNAGAEHYLSSVYLFFNTTAQFSSSLGLNQLNNQLYTYFMGDHGTSNIVLNFHPMPRTLNQQTLQNRLLASRGRESMGCFEFALQQCCSIISCCLSAYSLV